MSRPFRRFCFVLAARLKMTVNELLARMDSRELTEWMAFYTTESEDWQKQYQKNKELEAQAALDDEERSQRIKNLLLGKRNG